MKSKILIRGDCMSIYTNSYLPIHSYLANIVSNPKLNLSAQQQKTFQEVLNETTQQFTKEAAKSNTQAMQNSQMWNLIGAAGMNSAGFSDLLMSGIYTNLGTSSYPFATLTNGFNASAFNASNSFRNFYYPKNMSSNNANLYSFYNNLNQMRSKF